MKDLIIRKSLFILSLCMLSTFAPVNLYGLTKLNPYNYEINLQFDSTRLCFNGEMKVTWINNSQQRISEFPFRFSMDNTNSDITDATINNKPCQIVYTNQTYGGVKSFLLRSSFPIKLNKKAILKFRFKTEDDKYNKNRLIIDNGSWIPALENFENGKFDFCKQNLSNYLVTIRYSNGFLFATSGSVISESTENGFNTIVCKAKDISTFGIVGSKGLKCSEVRTDNGVLIHSYYFPDDSLWSNNYPRYAKKIIDFYSKKIGFYPQPVLNIVPSKAEIGNGYTIAPNIILTYRNDDSLTSNNDININMLAEWITAHEIAHQYWGYNYVLEIPEYLGNMRWFGISMGLYTDWLYNKEMRLDKQIHEKFFKHYTEGVEAGYNTTVTQPLDSLYKQNFDWGNVILHGKSFVILRMLAIEVGEEKFFDIYRYCLKNFKGVNVTLELFQRACEKVTKKNLNWFFDQWYKTNDYLEYEIQSVGIIPQDNKYHTSVKINRKGNAYTSNIEIAVAINDSTTITKIIDGKSKVTTVAFETAKSPVRIEIDSEKELPLINRKIWTNK